MAAKPKEFLHKCSGCGVLKMMPLEDPDVDPEWRDDDCKIMYSGKGICDGTYKPTSFTLEVK